jgi:sugar/nucleoside kinase (ribokinase family)
MSVVGLGFCCVDHICVVPRIPGVDEKVPVLDFIKQGGGVAGTAMVTVARLGAKASIVWCVGDDENGHYVISDFEKEGVNTEHVVIVPGLITPFSWVMVDKATGKRTIAFHYNPTILKHLARMDMEWIKDARLLYIDGAHEASIKAAKIARENGIPVICGTAEYAADYKSILKLVDIFIASVDWAKLLTGKSEPAEAAREILQAGPKVVVVTIGDRGSICVTKDKIIKKPAFHVNVVDTTGAGDVYSGAFTYGLLQGWPLEFIVEFSNAVAAIKCEKLGGRAGIPNLRKVEDFLRRHGIALPP